MIEDKYKFYNALKRGSLHSPPTRTYRTLSATTSPDRPNIAPLFRQLFHDTSLSSYSSVSSAALHVDHITTTTTTTTSRTQPQLLTY